MQGSIVIVERVSGDMRKQSENSESNKLLAIIFNYTCKKSKVLLFLAKDMIFLLIFSYF